MSDSVGKRRGNQTQSFVEMNPISHFKRLSEDRECQERLKNNGVWYFLRKESQA